METNNLEDITTSYAPADFPDALESSMYFTVNSDTSYESAVNIAVNKHFSELKEKQKIITPNLNNIWRKKFKEFLIIKNNKILEFITTKMNKHPVLSLSEHFFQRFGKNVYNYGQSLRDIVLDISNNDIIDDINGKCLSYEYETIEKYMEQTKYFMDQYKVLGDKILEKEKELRRKLENLDGVQKKIATFVCLEENEYYTNVMESIEKYLSKTFENNNLETNYNELIELYRHFLYIREVIKTIRQPEISEKEPLCTICFDDTVSHALSPCGHTFCSSCIIRQGTTCSLCRAHIKDRIKIYFT